MSNYRRRRGGMGMSIWGKSWQQYHRAETEFRVFADMMMSDTKRLAHEIEGFDQLDDEFTFYVRRNGRNQVQAFFGHRQMGRPKIDGSGTARERGASLVYSVGPTGGLMIGLFPCESELSTWKVGAVTKVYSRFGAFEIHSRLQRDLRYLGSYCRVTSLGATSSLADKVRIAWIGFTRSRQVEGKFAKASSHTITTGLIFNMADAIKAAILESLFKPFILLLLVLIFLPSGNRALIQVLRSANELSEHLEAVWFAPGGKAGPPGQSPMKNGTGLPDAHSSVPMPCVNDVPLVSIEPRHR